MNSMFARGEIGNQMLNQNIGGHIGDASRCKLNVAGHGCHV